MKLNVKATLFLLISVICHFQAPSQIASGHCKFLGNIIPASTPPDFTAYWNQISPENAGKWGSVESTRDVMSWSNLDNAYATAQTNGFLFKQHTLVWGQQQPPWLADLTQAEQKAEVEAWIQSYCERYPDTDFIDVVNEPLHAVPAYAAALGGNGLTGWDWVIWTFEKARAYCPNAKLLLNDYNIINNASATSTYLQIINLLKSRNLIDGIGEQGHFLESTPLATLTTNLDKLAETGLPIHISEFDINLADDTQQKNRYAELFPLLWTHPNVGGVTLWGYRQGEIWRQDAYLIRANGTARPALTWLKDYVESSAGICDPVGIENHDRGAVSLYPNPSRGNFTLEIDGGASVLTITDASGNVLKHVDAPGPGSVQVALDAPPGIYILKLTQERKTRIVKLVIK
jgi:endo-1,4-beta-xylanase